MYNNYVKGQTKDPYAYDIKKKEPSKPKKEVRKPVAENFVPKRFGMSVSPPMLSTMWSIQFCSTWCRKRASFTTTRCGWSPEWNKLLTEASSSSI